MSATDTSAKSRVHDYYLWSFSVIYLFAFSSIYSQIPGLYGDNGVLPVRAFAQVDQRGAGALVQAMKSLPSLVWLGPSAGLSFQSTLEIIALTGIVISFLQMVFKGFRDFWMYFLLFGLYFSIYQVGQTFMSFQWDILLLEAGFLTALMAPIRALPFLFETGPHKSLTFWLIRWLLFRLMFASGVVKLTSGCPKWWSLTALDIHFESQCIPTPIAWFAHHFPSPLLKLAVVLTYVIEIAVPFLFFIPIKNLRIFSFASQVVFQLAIILTGNYNFFNLLTIVLCLSLLKDEDIDNGTASADTTSSSTSVPRPRFLLPRVIAKLTTVFIYFAFTYWTINLFSIKWVAGSLSMSPAFTPKQFQQFIIWALPLSIALGTISLTINIIGALIKCLLLPTHGFGRIANLLYTALYACVVVFMFGISLVPLTTLDQTNSVKLWPIINRWHKSVDGYHLVNGYGLFRQMTGVNGRPEIVIEGSDDINSLTSWKEYHFLYKPGDITRAPKFNIPHQPRLDWQMWFAALDTYQNNPWLLNLCYRLLNGQPEVLDLLDKNRLPFKKPPAYLRVRAYTYRYTGKTAKNWWRRSEEKEYMPALSVESLKKFIRANHIETDRKLDLNDQSPTVTNTLAWIRQTTSKLNSVQFIYALFSTAYVISRI